MPTLDRRGTPFTVDFAAGGATYPLQHVIRWFLTKQPASWALIAPDEDTMLDMIAQGYYSIALLRDDKEYHAMALYSLQREMHGLEATLEFLTCDKFYQTAPFYYKLEELFRSLGCVRIKAIAHPALAHYALKKCGYTTPGVFIIKTLDSQLRN